MPRRGPGIPGVTRERRIHRGLIIEFNKFDKEKGRSWSEAVKKSTDSAKIR